MRGPWRQPRHCTFREAFLRVDLFSQVSGEKGYPGRWQSHGQSALLLESGTHNRSFNHTFQSHSGKARLSAKRHTEIGWVCPKSDGLETERKQTCCGVPYCQTPKSLFSWACFMFAGSSSTHRIQGVWPLSQKYCVFQLSISVVTLAGTVHLGEHSFFVVNLLTQYLSLKVHHACCYIPRACGANPPHYWHARFN